MNVCVKKEFDLGKNFSPIRASFPTAKLLPLQDLWLNLRSLTSIKKKKKIRITAQNSYSKIFRGIPRETSVVGFFPVMS